MADEQPAMPRLLRGAGAIGEYLGMSAAAVSHRHREGSLPTVRVGGVPFATTGALDEWRILYQAGKLPTR